MQTYRNLSRHTKQYFYGDKALEQQFAITLRNFYRIPKTAETPVDLIKSNPSRRFADQGDREFELVSYNQHPYQLMAYDLNN